MDDNALEKVIERQWDPPVEDERGRLTSPETTPPGSPDSFLSPIESACVRKEWGVPIPITDLGPQAPPPWIWKGFLARGHSSLVIAHPKVGKTTLLAHLLRALSHGDQLGCEVLDAPILVVSEESRYLWTMRRDALELPKSVHVWSRPFRGRPSRTEWEQWCLHVGNLVRKTGYGLVVIDTLANLWWVDHENDASESAQALAPLSDILLADAALKVIHHSRKSGGGEGLSCRGSSYIMSWADIVIEMRRHRPEDDRDRKRILKGSGRFDECFRETVIELSGGRYQILGDAEQATQSSRLSIIENMLPTNAPGLTPEEVLANWPNGVKPGVTTVRKDLKLGSEKSRWREAGVGVRGDALRYYRVTGLVSSTPPLIEGRNESNPTPSQPPLPPKPPAVPKKPRR
ncbi:MAG: AAA family ATPase [Planctomycetes bacterium]|nr:AAA family ATPase [Planctomycetota bacterium]